MLGYMQVQIEQVVKCKHHVKTRTVEELKVIYSLELIAA